MDITIRHSKNSLLTIGFFKPLKRMAAFSIIYLDRYSRSIILLEVGCGAGRFLYWARERGLKSVRGFDLSPEQVEASRALGLAAEVAFYRDYLSRCDEEFDLVVGLDVIEHLRRDKVVEFLEFCYSAQQPSGCLFITTPNGSPLRPGPVIERDLTTRRSSPPTQCRLFSA